MRRASLRENSLYSLAGLLAFTLSQWAILVGLARFGDPSVVGDYTLSLGIATPIFVLVSMQLRAGISTDHRREFADTEYVSARVIGIAVGVLAACSVSLLIFETKELWLLVGAASAVRAFDLGSDLVYGFLQRAESMRRIGLSKILQALLQLAFAAAAFFATSSAFWAMTAVAVASAVTFVTYDLRSAIEAGVVLQLRDSWKELLTRVRKLAWFSTPLAVGAALDALNLVMPRFFIEEVVGRDEVGIYAAVAYLSVAQGILVSAVGDAFRPRIADLLSKSSDSLLTLMKQLCSLSVLSAGLSILGAAVVGEQVLNLLYGPIYGERSSLLVWLSLAALPWNLSGVAATFLTAARSFPRVMVGFAAMAAAQAAGLAILVPTHGAIGAAWAVGIAMTVRFAVTGSFAAKLYSERYAVGATAAAK